MMSIFDEAYVFGQVNVKPVQMTRGQRRAALIIFLIDKGFTMVESNKRADIAMGKGQTREEVEFDLAMQAAA